MGSGRVSRPHSYDGSGYGRTRGAQGRQVRRRGSHPSRGGGAHRARDCPVKHGPWLCVLSALRWVVGSETMTTPVGVGITPCTATTSSVLGAPASIMGSELSPLPLYGAPVLHFPRAGVPNLERLALSGWGDAGFQAVVNFRFTEFYEVEVAGRRSYVNFAEPCCHPAYSIALRWVSRVGRNGIVDSHPRLGAITPYVHLRPKPRRVVQRSRVEPLQLRRRNYLAHDGRAAPGTELAVDRQSALAYVLESRQGFSLDSQAPLREDDEDREGRTRLLLAVPAVARRGQYGFRLAFVADATVQATSDDVRRALSSLPASCGGF